MKRSNIFKLLGSFLLVVLLVTAIWNIGLHVYDLDQPISATPQDCEGELRFAVIGDYGDAGQPEADVSELVRGWDVDLIITTGDNNYPDGKSSTIDENIGQYYSEYIFPYEGMYKSKATENRLFPTLGNHDWRDQTLQPYYDYFTLPGNERYYEFQSGPVHFFIVDSDRLEPDGRSEDSKQAAWLEAQMTGSSLPWKLVFLHHPPYSSSLRGRGDVEMRWPFELWGADAVFAGHEHFYERIALDGIMYFINGLGGRWSSINSIHRFLFINPGSMVRYNLDYGAQLVTASPSCINFSFYARNGELIDSITLLN